MLSAYNSWDANLDGKLQLDEFEEMVKFANPMAGKRRITRAFIAASVGGGEGQEEEHVSTDRLGPALSFYGLFLKARPADYSSGGGAPADAAARAETAGHAQAGADVGGTDDAIGGAAPSDQVMGMTRIPVAARMRAVANTVKMMTAAQSAMQQLSQLTRALQVMGDGGADLENIKEEDVIEAA